MDANHSANHGSSKEEDETSSAGSEITDEGTPRWVKLFGIIALILVVIVFGIHVAGGGFHSHSFK